MVYKTYTYIYMFSLIIPHIHTHKIEILVGSWEGAANDDEEEAFMIKDTERVSHHSQKLDFFQWDRCLCTLDSPLNHHISLLPTQNLPKGIPICGTHVEINTDISASPGLCQSSQETISF